MSTKRIVYISVFAAMAFILMSTFSIPILPNAPYLRFEPSEIPLLVVACMIDPWAGLFTNLIKDLLYYFFRAKSIFGPTADFLITSSFVVITGIVYRRNRSNIGLIGALIIGIIGRLLVMVPVNIIILGLQFGMSPSKVLSMMIPIIIPFNLIKGGINAIGAFLIVQALLKRLNYISVDGGNQWQ